MRTARDALIAALVAVLPCAGAGCDDDPPAAPADAGGMALLDGGLPPDAPGVIGSPDAAREDRFRPEAGEPYLLSQTGLYADLASRTLAPGVRPFEPAFALWSDGSAKRRWISLPPGTRIDTSDPEHWHFPVGTRLWKEFSRDGVLLETRLIERTGPGANDFWMGAFVWRTDRSDAEYQVDGATSINGTDHDAPSTKQCSSCHGGEPGRVLGFSALQLGASGAEPPAGLRLADLIAEGLLSHPPASPTVALPGDRASQTALGYLHANCGHCHSPTGLAYRDVDLVLRLSLAEPRLEDTGLYRTARQVNMTKAVGGPTVRLVPGDPAASGLYHRMGSMQDKVRMPPLATKHLHPDGLEAVSAFIRALP